MIADAKPMNPTSLDVKVSLAGADLAPSRLKELEGDSRVFVAAKLVENGELSMGRAAELCGMNTIDFMDELIKLGVPIIAYTDDEIGRGAW